MTNFGILMEIKGIEDPFKWSREVVNKCQEEYINLKNEDIGKNIFEKAGIFYSPDSFKFPSKTSEGTEVKSVKTNDLNFFKEAFGEYADYILTFIDNMNEVFEFGDDWGMYIPEVKYLSPEPLVNYTNLALNEYPNVHFVGDALSARGITVSGAHGIYVAEYLL
jgi:uncharacterized FAD-dependent dehydrogenase